jgi:hypothetical protein
MAASTFAPETVLWLLIARAQVKRIPAQPWVLADAVRFMINNADEGGPLSRAAKGFAEGGETLERGVRDGTRRLVATKVLNPEGSGWSAGLAMPAAKVVEAKRCLESLSRADELVLRVASQRVVAMVTIWSKNA